VTTDRILLTGASGRVATQLLPGLDDREVRLTDHVGPADGGPDLLVGELTDAALLDRALDGVDAVVHLAGNPDPAAAWQELEQPNVAGFVALLAAAERHGVRRVVFASSVHAMGAHEGSGRWPVDATWPPAPCCAYGATKAFDEALARAYAYRTGLSLVGLRLGLCSPDPTPDEAAAGWIGPQDLQQVVRRALDVDVRFGVYPAVSWASGARWDLRTAVEELGYHPAREPGDEDPPQTRHLCTCRPGGQRSGT
jgi:nucleoside-diphosphate-sugar epimerase